MFQKLCSFCYTLETLQKYMIVYDIWILHQKEDVKIKLYLSSTVSFTLSRSSAILLTPLGIWGQQPPIGGHTQPLPRDKSVQKNKHHASHSNPSQQNHDLCRWVVSFSIRFPPVAVGFWAAAQSTGERLRLIRSTYLRLAWESLGQLISDQLGRFGGQPFSSTCLRSTY